MVGHTSSSTGGGGLALALGLSSGACERVSGSASPAPRPKLPLSDKEGDRALAPGTLKRSLDAPDELVGRISSGGSGLAGSDTLPSQTVPANKRRRCDDNPELVLDLSELPADILGEQMGQLDPRKESCMGDNDNRASLLTATSIDEVRIPLSLHKT